jgi:IMP dehydrogenase
LVSCGSVTLAEFRATARLTLVSEQSFTEGRASVIRRDTVAELA